MNDKTDKALSENGIRIFNLSSLSELGERLFPLVPPFPILFNNSEEEKMFDMNYASYIMSSDSAFYNLMKIVYPEYAMASDRFITYILIDDSEASISLTESLIKFIQQRYGLNCYIMKAPEDWEALEPATFSELGLQMIDQDKERLSLLISVNAPTDSLSPFFMPAMKNDDYE